MLRSALVCSLLSLLMLTACVSSMGISQEDVSGSPTTYATVVKAPNPQLMGHWRRSTPPNLEKPWMFQYWLVKHGDKYAVFYNYDSRRKNSFKGWASFNIDGDSMTSGVDGATFFVEGGKVFMRVAGRNEPYPMEKLD
jgi:hypothetical protein